jgi:hypothetical protein
MAIVFGHIAGTDSSLILGAITVIIQGVTGFDGAGVDRSVGVITIAEVGGITGGCEAGEKDG